MKNNIILIGFMGVGKGSLARELCKQTEYFAIDTDDLIESMQNKRIKKIFEQEGEAHFRNLEAECALWLEKNVNSSIISTGGGFFKVKNLKKIGTVVYLESSIEGILKRIYEHPNAAKKIKKRPLLKDKPAAKKLFAERKNAYESLADITINTEGKSSEAIAKKLLKLL